MQERLAGLIGGEYTGPYCQFSPHIRVCFSSQPCKTSPASSPALPLPSPSPLRALVSPALQVLLRELLPGCGEAGAAHPQGQDRLTRHVQGKLKLTPKSRLVPREIQKKSHCLLTDCINMILKMLLYLNMNLKPALRT